MRTEAADTPRRREETGGGAAETCKDGFTETEQPQWGGEQGLDKPKTRSGAAPLRACQSLKSAHDRRGQTHRRNSLKRDETGRFGQKGSSSWSISWLNESRW